MAQENGPCHRVKLGNRQLSKLRTLNYQKLNQATSALNWFALLTLLTSKLVFSTAFNVWIKSLSMLNGPAYFHQISKDTIILVAE